jgi:hypothetical protein
VGCPSGIPERARAPGQPQSTPEQPPSAAPTESADTLLKDINALCHELNALSANGTPDLQALKSVKYSLKAAIASASGSQALPEKDVFHPNRKTWAETAKHMGAGKPQKRKPSPTGGNTSTEHIGTIKGKHTHKYTDPYADGDRPGKHAKPDVVSAAANERARTAVNARAPPSAAVLAPVRASPSTAAAGSVVHSFTPGNRPTVDPLRYPPLSAVPGFAFSHFPPVLPGSTFAPLSAAAPGSAYAGTAHNIYFRGG